MNVHPLEDDSLDRDYAIEKVLWELLYACQDALIERHNPGGISKGTTDKLRNAVLHWREHPELYLMHPAWLTVETEHDTD